MGNTYIRIFRSYVILSGSNKGAVGIISISDGTFTTGLDGTGAYNATVTLTDDDATWTALTASSYKYQLNLTDASGLISIPVDGTLTIIDQIPQA